MKHTLLSLWLLSTLLSAQDARPVAFTNARILTLAGPVIDRGTLVARNGTIAAVGADVAPPAGAIIVDCQGGTLMPGLVSAFSRAGFQSAPTPRPEQATGRRGRRGGGAPQPEGGGGRSAENRAATKVVERLDPKQDVFADLLVAGVTTLALTPPGNGFPGLGAILRPDGRNLDALTQDDDAFVFVGMARDSQVKKVLKDGFEQAKKIVEARKKPKEEPKPEAKPADAPKPADAGAEPKDAPKQPEQPKPQPEPKPDQPKPDQPKPDQPKPQPEPKPPETPKPPDGKPQDGKPADAAPAPAAAPKPEERKDPNLEVLADLLEGKRRAVLQIDSAADLLHWFHACGEELKFPRAIAATRYDLQAGTFDSVLDQVKKLGAPLLLPPDLSSVPRTRVLTNPARTLHEAGVEVGFVLGDSQGAVRQLFFRLMELVRSGLPADVALRGVTVVPSKALGVEAQVGTLEVGKKANLLLFSADPLYASSELRSVWLEGKKVEARAKQ